MRLSSPAKFPPPTPANDRFGFVQWPADALRRGRPALRDAPQGRVTAALDQLLPLIALGLVLWATGFRG